MASILKKVHDEITAHLNGLLDRSNAIQGYLARNFYRDYQNAQRQRWMTENASQGDRWQPLTSLSYQNSKPIRFKSYPGSGSKMMIATSRLQGSVIGIGSYGTGDHRVVTSQKKIEIETTTPYAPYAAEHRPIMEFSDEQLDEWQRNLGDFIEKALGS